MPVNGKIWAADELRFDLSTSASGSHSGDGTGGHSHGLTADTLSTPDTSNLDQGFYLVLGGTSSGDAWSVDYTGPGALSGVNYTGSGWTSVEVNLVLTDLVLYDEGSTFRLLCDYELIVQGVSELTGSIDETGFGLGPCYVPLMGVALGIVGGCQAGTTGLPSYAADDVYSYASTTTATGTGSWKFKPVGASDYEVLPVTLAPGSAPGVPGGCEDPGIGEVSADDTGLLTVSSYAESSVSKILYNDGDITECTEETFCDGVSQGLQSQTQVPPAHYEQFETTSEDITRGGSVRGIPDLETAIKRFNSDFGALVYRHELPGTTYIGVANCDNNGVTSTTTSTPEVHPYQDELLDFVDNNPADIEDSFDYPAYAPWSTQGFYTKTIDYTEVVPGILCPEAQICPGPGDSTSVTTWVGYVELPEDESYASDRAYQFPYSVGSQTATYLSHNFALARYVNTRCNLLWSYALFTGPWNLDGGSEVWNDYWKLLGSQHLYHASLTAPETRNHLVSEPLEADAHGPFMDLNVSELRFLGIHRWQTKTVTPRTTYTFDDNSEDLWTATDCVAVFGSSIVVTASAATCELELDLGSFTIEPFMWVHLADRITCDWVTTNVDEIKVYLEAQDGTRILLNNNQPGVAKPRPSGRSTEYAGSWAQDYGAGITTDLGADSMTPEGVSAGHMGDPHLAFAFQMLADWTASKLVFVITPTVMVVPVTLEYPIFEYTKSSERRVIPENAHQSAVAHPQGSGTRHGIWNTGTSGTINNPPANYDPYEIPNIVDWLIAERLVVEGIAHDDNLTTELTQLFDTYEGQSVGNTRNTSNGFWLPPGNSDWPLALVNSYAESPPLGAFPYKERNPITWLTDGEYVQHTWIWAQEPDYFINPQERAELRADDDTTVWTSAGSGVTGWAVTKHSHAVDNSETDFGIWNTEDQFAEDIRPFRGYYMVIFPVPSGGITYAVAPDLSHFRAYINTGGFIVTEWADNALNWDGVMQTFEAEQIHYSISKFTPFVIRLSFSDGVKVYYTQSTNGRDFATPVEVGDGTRMITVDSNDGGFFKYFLDGTDLKVEHFDAGGNQIGSTAVAVTGVDDVQFDGHSSSIGSNNFRVILQVVISGSRTQKESTNGIDFA